MQSFSKLDFQARKNGDNNYCSVIATATVCKLSYRRAYKKLERVGREHGRGTFMIYEVVRRQGYDLQLLEDVRGMTVSKFVELHPRGTYLLHTHAHVIAIVDGVINDHSDETRQGYKSRRRIKHCHKVVLQNNSHIPEMKNKMDALRFLGY